MEIAVLCDYGGVIATDPFEQSIQTGADDGHDHQQGRLRLDRHSPTHRLVGHRANGSSCSRKWAIVAATWLAGALVFHFQVWWSGFDKLGGDRGDQRLAVLLHEHWLKVFSGDASWRTPNFFHPVSDTLGYADTFVLDLVFYAPLRMFGLDPMMALQFTTFLLGATGFVGMYLVCRRLVGAPLVVSLTCAWLVAFANNLFMQTGHQQLFAVNWVPWCILLGARAVRAASPRAAVAWAGGCGLMTAALLYSTYYIGWFMVFTAGLVGAIFLILRREPLPQPVRHRWQLASGATLGFAMPMIPFALTYLPKLDETGGRRIAGVIAGLPDARDLLNHGRGNIWSSTLNGIAGEPTAGHSAEQAMALTPVLMLTVLACGVALRRCARDDRSARAALARSLVASSVVLSVLPIRFGQFSLWRGVWTVVPGAHALRAVDRIQLLNDVVAALAIACTSVVITRQRAAAAQTWARRSLVLLAALAVVLVGEQINTTEQARLDRSAEMELLSRVPDPPPRCRSFIIAPTPDQQKGAAPQIDAMWIAQSTGLPTLNGYSGASPPLWDLNPSNSEYLGFTVRWVARNDLRNVCLYDPIAHHWDRDPLEGVERA